ncbi:sterol desaturase family protein [Roseococcus suduntuyensis]|uniref:Sterol desaturase/sphingolipid hydroxylase (Fatty acid hydroxylase superfamily) n=1 Tax=Roseococcus suduntuyensis TaxID=455361 RepID=A0A840AAD3_9PROT|nr:sterol desaturase family protein [Roseococcus suduntuyensis]MBB3897852.1 sterol desaturase/sphingolipid hydroxylase (fatty acid hydroxylase superfamily) [Roseococcus suduntuyensis]
MELEATLRLGAFAGVLAALILAERLVPWAQPRPLGMRRWWPNLGLVAVGSVLVRFTLPLAAVAAAFWAQAQGIGLMNWLDLPLWVAIPLTVVVFDLLIYFQHRVFHHVPWLWRLHRVHHADPEMDATTGVRFHPVEIWLSMVIKIAFAVALGAPPEGILAFEIILNATSLFEHAAIRIPPKLDRALGWVIVTPNLHRIHHSEREHETNSHYGFCLSLWDRLFGTWRGKWEGELVLGVRGHRDLDRQTLRRMLTQPLD